MEKLAAYFLEHLIFDFEGELDMKIMQKLLDDSPEAVQLMNAMKDDSDVEDFIIALTDGLRDHIATGVTSALLVEEFKDFSQS